MTSKQRAAFLKDLREVMRKHGVDNMEAFISLNECCLFDADGNGLASFHEITVKGSARELMEYSA